MYVLLTLDLYFVIHCLHCLASAYYHSSALIASMPQISINSGVKILSYSFSETQQGKSGADRDISKGGRKMRSHRGKQHNVITPEDMFDALNATLQLRATSVFLAELVENSVSSTKIEKITELSYFEYDGSDARVWKFHGIGDGEVIKDLKHTNATLDIKKQGGKLATTAKTFDKNPGQYEEPTFWLLPHEVAPMLDIEPNARDDDIVTPRETMTSSQLPKMRAWRRQVEHEDMDDEHFEVEVEPSDEDIVITEEDFHRHLTPTMLKKFFSDVDRPVTPNTPVPAGAAEFD
ncbi:hypothetical protein PRIPAC_96564 [Pristionchus pacificus]|uniref:NAD(P)H-hydrate epimerase n=1 Tax=Pristionchus pacificus TaxID=54126 RepID=A0A2A6D2K5_PRIPA|nr:hypothetical protein PRIPAC_96564 [Pristionchus pacificus]|eukprot:PDM84620.1 hypothetical protein PRIPAC_33643 [Pristionchus pacificus]